MLTDLHGTVPDQAARTGAWREAAADGLTTLAGGLVPVAPFFLCAGFIAFGLSITVSLLVLCGLGAWTGRFSRQGVLLSAVKLAALGLLTVLACLLMHYLVAPASPMV
jgi:predicted membrane protein (TIGR00267 family)